MRLILLFSLLFILACSNNYNKEWKNYISNKTYSHSTGLHIIFNKDAVPSLSYRNSLINLTVSSLRAINFKFQKAFDTNRALYSLTIPLVGSMKVGFEVRDNKLYSTVNMLSPMEQLFKDVRDYVDWNNLYLIGEEDK